jgi:hypothetical protein
MFDLVKELQNLSYDNFFTPSFFEKTPFLKGFN